MLEIMLPVNGKKLPPKGVWMEAPFQTSGGTSLMKEDNWMGAATLASHTSYSYVADLNKGAIVSSPGYNLNLQQYGERSAIGSHYMGGTSRRETSFLAGAYGSGGTMVRNVYRMNYIWNPPNPPHQISPNTLGLLPAYRSGMGLCATREEKSRGGLYLIGGSAALYGAFPAVNTIYFADVDANTVTQVTGMSGAVPPGLMMPGAAWIKNSTDRGTMVVYGGKTDANTFSDKWYFMRPDLIWMSSPTYGAQLPGLWNHAMWYHAGYIYVFGGETAGGPNLKTWKINWANMYCEEIGNVMPVPSYLTNNVAEYNGYLYGYIATHGKTIMMRL